MRKLREADRLLGEGKLVAEVAKELGISEHTFGRWRNQYGSMKADDAKEFRRLKDENGRLKRMGEAEVLIINEEPECQNPPAVQRGCAEQDRTRRAPGLRLGYGSDPSPSCGVEERGAATPCQVRLSL